MTNVVEGLFQNVTALFNVLRTVAVTGTATASIDEADIVAGGKTIILTLTNGVWVAAGAVFDAQRQNIIDGLDSAQSETLGWNNEVRDKLAVTAVVRTSDTIVTVTLSAQSGYDITAQETITATVPVGAVDNEPAPIIATPSIAITSVVGCVPGGGVDYNAPITRIYTNTTGNQSIRSHISLDDVDEAGIAANPNGVISIPEIGFCLDLDGYGGGGWVYVNGSTLSNCEWAVNYVDNGVYQFIYVHIGGNSALPNPTTYWDDEGVVDEVTRLHYDYS